MFRLSSGISLICKSIACTDLLFEFAISNNFFLLSDIIFFTFSLSSLAKNLSTLFFLSFETNWICPIMIESSASAENPFFKLAILAALLAAAITDGSSIAIGIKYFLPFILKLVAIPNGIGIKPIAFSIILLTLLNPKFFGKS